MNRNVLGDDGDDDDADILDWILLLDELLDPPWPLGHFGHK